MTQAVSGYYAAGCLLNFTVIQTTDQNPVDDSLLFRAEQKDKRHQQRRKDQRQ